MAVPFPPIKDKNPMSQTIRLLMMLSIIGPGCVLEQQAPPTPTIAEQEQVAEAIINQLKTNNLHIHKIDNAYVITYDHSEFTVSEGIGISDPYGDFYYNGETLEIRLPLVGTANFRTDRQGNLRPVIRNPYKKHNTQSRQPKNKRRKTDRWITY